MECRLGAISRKHPEPVIDLCRRDWARPSSPSNILNPNPNFGQVTLTDNSATSNYQALQVKFERRLSQGLQALASYTWSHSIDIASTDAFANYLNAPNSVANPMWTAATQTLTSATHSQLA